MNDGVVVEVKLLTVVGGDSACDDFVSVSTEVILTTPHELAHCGEGGGDMETPQFCLIFKAIISCWTYENG